MWMASCVSTGSTESTSSRLAVLWVVIVIISLVVTGPDGLAHVTAGVVRALVVRHPCLVHGLDHLRLRSIGRIVLQL
jgi:hypothetical protein